MEGNFESSSTQSLLSGEDEKEIVTLLQNFLKFLTSNSISSEQVPSKTVNFSLFNRDLLLRHKDYTISENRVPSESVKQVFTKTRPAITLHKGRTNPSYETSSGLYYAGGKTSPERRSKKSNSTGFLGLWRSKDVLHRSHSDGSDNFIVKLYRSQKENRRKWRMKMYSHQSRIEMQNNKTFLTSAKNS